MIAREKGFNARIVNPINKEAAAIFFIFGNIEKLFISFILNQMKELAMIWVMRVEREQPAIPKIGIKRKLKNRFPRAPRKEKTMNFLCWSLAKIALLMIADGKMIKMVRIKI